MPALPMRRRNWSSRQNRANTRDGESAQPENQADNSTDRGARACTGDHTSSTVGGLAGAIASLIPCDDTDDDTDIVAREASTLQFLNRIFSQQEAVKNTDDGFCHHCPYDRNFR